MNKSSFAGSKKLLESGVSFSGKKLSPSSKRYHRKIDKYGDEMFLEIIKKLKCTNPKKIDNYPHETPYIEEREVEE